jgi:hypothetical protein
VGLVAVCIAIAATVLIVEDHLGTATPIEAMQNYLVVTAPPQQQLISPQPQYIQPPMAPAGGCGGAGGLCVADNVARKMAATARTNQGKWKREVRRMKREVKGGVESGDAVEERGEGRGVGGKNEEFGRDKMNRSKGEIRGENEGTRGY